MFSMYLIVSRSDYGQMFDFKYPNGTKSSRKSHA